MNLRSDDFITVQAGRSASSPLLTLVAEPLSYILSSRSSTTARMGRASRFVLFSRDRLLLQAYTSLFLSGHHHPTQGRQAGRFCSSSSLRLRVSLASPPAPSSRADSVSSVSGFNIGLTPRFSPSWMTWVKAYRGVLAVPNLRGGDE